MEEVWDQIGKRLRGAREAADLAVDDVVFRTRIPRSVVEALEADDFSVFTSPTYAKSFLRQYSEYLKVDAEPWLNALEPASYVSGEAWQPMFSGGEPQPSAAKRPVRDPRQKEREPEPARNQWSAVWLMLLSAGLVIGVVKGYQFLDAKFGHEEPQQQAKTRIAAPSEAATAPVKETEPSPQIPTSAPSRQDVSQAAAGVPQEEPRANPPRALIIRE
ncbi:helix-turn-helix domain-containing protein [Luteolibacter sp. SL250]|uniref:helix-turn-helix domain-containing protein n=1 Tax=Luteolibacter sp. SL250 TaxID=2995170 RepID=UPI00226F59A1|nr:helix-turn-helix domain-containing protein [Luteolibacter sp. SL250]WAC21667.1 helix-turn-helix domain-containing protein [Luteolibacter sp. SL250]